MEGLIVVDVLIFSALFVSCFVALLPFFFFFLILVLYFNIFYSTDIFLGLSVIFILRIS